MKIVLIDKEEGLKVGGITVYNQRLNIHLSASGHKVFILRFAKKKSRQKYIYRLPYYLAEPRSFIFLPSENTLGIIRKHLMKIKPDIVYACIGLSPLDFLLPSLCHELRIPLVGVWHGDFSDSLSPFQVLTKSIFLAYLPFCRQLDLLHVFSEKLAQFYVSHGIPRKRTLVLPNGGNQDFYTKGKSSFGKRFNIKRGILFLGRLTLQKNPEILIKAFLSLNPPKGTKLVLVGHGELEEELRENYKDKRIIFTGIVKDEEQKLDILRSCQIFVLPSRFEGMSLALLEAMSVGLACVVSDAGTNRELVENAGIVIPGTRLKQELPLALRLLLKYPDFAKDLGRKARTRILKSYSQKVLFRKFEKALVQTIADYKKRGSPQSLPLPLDRIITDKLKSIWKKAQQISSSF